MKPLSEALLARLSSEVLTLCLCWKLTRTDGVCLGLTDHDQPLTVSGQTYQPGAALTAGQFVQSLDQKPGRGAAAGALTNDAIDEADLKAGLWNGCAITVYHVDWQRPDLGGIWIWSGFLSEVTLSQTGQFEAELVSQKAELERPIGRQVQRLCDAVLGDERCGVDPAGRSCDQRFETCRSVFSNTENFRGFPHLPGNDFVLSGPAATQNDGGKR